MKKEQNNLWLSADDNRNPPYCTVFADGTLSLRKFMHEALSDTLLIKFLDDSCTLVIKNSDNDVGNQAMMLQRSCRENTLKFGFLLKFCCLCLLEQ